MGPELSVKGKKSRKRGHWRLVKAEYFRLTRVVSAANAVFAHKVIVDVGCAVAGFCFAVYHVVRSVSPEREQNSGFRVIWDFHMLSPK